MPGAARLERTPGFGGLGEWKGLVTLGITNERLWTRVLGVVNRIITTVIFIGQTIWIASRAEREHALA